MRTYSNAAAARAACIKHGPAEWLLPVDGRKPIRLIANDTIMAAFDDGVFTQAVTTAEAPGIDQIIVGADAHLGFGVPVGATLISDTHLYPCIVGPDLLCSMSYLQTNVPDEVIADKATRRALLNAISERIPTGAGHRQAQKARRLDRADLRDVAVWGAHPACLRDIGIPEEWTDRCEQAHYGEVDALTDRLGDHLSDKPFDVDAKLQQIGSYGGGNHFGEAQAVTVLPGMEAIAECFGIQSGTVGFLSHCGSRGFGFQLAALHFKGLEHRFTQWGIPFPGGEKELIYAPIGTPEADAYLLDLSLGANFAVVNHLLINTYVLEAFQEVLPGAKGELVYHISHNILREEIVDGRKTWVGRKGATRAFPAGHHALKGTRYEDTGHPILLPGNPEAGSYIMVGQPAAAKTAYSINHGAGRAMGRNHAKRTLKQAEVDAAMNAADILYNGRSYPIDEAPAAYKDFTQVTASVEEAGLAKTVAKLRARFVVKDSDQSAEGAA